MGVKFKRDTVEWYRAVAKAFRAVQRDAQAIAQGAKDLPSDGAFAMDSQLEAEFVRLAPDASAPLLAELARVGDTLRGLAWWQERIDDWKPATPQGEILFGLVANALDGLEVMRGEDARRLRRGRVDFICRQVGSQLAAASAAQAVEAERRADTLIADGELKKVTKERDNAKEKKAVAEALAEERKRVVDSLGQKIDEATVAVGGAKSAAQGAERAALRAEAAAKDRAKADAMDADFVATFREFDAARQEEAGSQNQIMAGVLADAKEKGRLLGNCGVRKMLEWWRGWTKLGKPDAGQYEIIHRREGRRPT